MTLEQQLAQRLRQLGYWDCTAIINAANPTHPLSLAWSNPNTTVDAETMFQLVWLLGSSSRRQRLSATDLRILERSAAELALESHILPATKTYVKYLWQQVYGQESSQHLSSGESF
ncbi:MAG TPA: hypothetical protein V6D13_02370 [Halomicronema sp.]